MSTWRIFRTGVALTAIVAVLALTMLPAAHLHRSFSGDALIHSHLTNDPLDHPKTLDDGDHAPVRIFAPVFTAERTHHSVSALAPITWVVSATPEISSVGSRQPIDAPVIHGPPLRGLSLRAPPA